jgi:hypothetical protein
MLTDPGVTHPVRKMPAGIQTNQIERPSSFFGPPSIVFHHSYVPHLLKKFIGSICPIINSG